MITPFCCCCPSLAWSEQLDTFQSFSITNKCLLCAFCDISTTPRVASQVAATAVSCLLPSSMDDADPSSSRNGRSSGEGCSSSDFDSGHVSGIAKANRKRGRSRGHTSTAARGGKRRKPAANSRAAAAPAHPRRGRLQLSELPGGYIFIKGMVRKQEHVSPCSCQLLLSRDSVQGADIKIFMLQHEASALCKLRQGGQGTCLLFCNTIDLFVAGKG